MCLVQRKARLAPATGKALRAQPSCFGQLLRSRHVQRGGSRQLCIAGCRHDKVSAAVYIVKVGAVADQVRRASSPDRSVSSVQKISRSLQPVPCLSTQRSSTWTACRLPTLSRLTRGRTASSHATTGESHRRAPSSCQHSAYRCVDNYLHSDTDPSLELMREAESDSDNATQHATIGSLELASATHVTDHAYLPMQPPTVILLA